MTNYPRVEVEWYDVEDDPRVYGTPGLGVLWCI